MKSSKNLHFPDDFRVDGILLVHLDSVNIRSEKWRPTLSRKQLQQAHVN